MTSRYKYVIFDVGGTLVRWGDADLFATFLTGFALDLHPTQIAIDGAHLRSRMIESFNESRHAAVGLGATGDSVTRFWREVLKETLVEWGRPGYAQGMLEPLTHAVTMGAFDIPFEDAIETLQDLRAAGYRLGVVSNWNENLPVELAHWGLDTYFDFVIASSLVGVAKPSPEIFQIALDKAGCQAHEALYVGDNVIDDCQGATGAGLAAALIRRDTGSLAQGVPCTMIFSSLAALADRLLYEEVAK
jgi:putative hydrolase of the HAD superfamily